MSAVWSSHVAIWIGAIAFVSAIAAIGALLTDLGPWYRQLRKLTWQPPDWLFGPVWTTVFALMAAAIVLVWTAAPANDRNHFAALLAVNAVLNILWSYLFFAAKRPGWALVEVAALWVSIAALIVFAARYSSFAAIMLGPYLVWVTFASVLNWAIVRLNSA